MNIVSLRAAINVVFAVGGFFAFDAAAECPPWQTWSCEEPFPLPEYPCNCGGGSPGVYNHYPLPNMPGNPYPATCGSSEQQRKLHTLWELQSYEASTGGWTLGTNESINVIYDDGLSQDYVLYEELDLLGGWSAPIGYRKNVCNAR